MALISLASNVSLFIEILHLPSCLRKCDLGMTPTCLQIALYLFLRLSSWADLRERFFSFGLMPSSESSAGISVSSPKKNINMSINEQTFSQLCRPEPKISSTFIKAHWLECCTKPGTQGNLRKEHKTVYQNDIKILPLDPEFYSGKDRQNTTRTVGNPRLTPRRLWPTTRKATLSLKRNAPWICWPLTTQ